MRKNLYEAFTLVEMLIVMGILIILMAVGITAGRYAINRANNVAHQDAVKQIYTALQAYYTDHREFPAAADLGTLMGTGGALYDYLDQGAFNGGTAADYYYFVDTATQQSTVVCVTLGGDTAATVAKEDSLYCDGNGFGDADLGLGTSTAASLTDHEVKSTDTVYGPITDTAASAATWDGSRWQ